MPAEPRNLQEMGFTPRLRGVPTPAVPVFMVWAALFHTAPKMPDVWVPWYLRQQPAAAKVWI